MTEGRRVNSRIRERINPLPFRFKLLPLYRPSLPLKFSNHQDNSIRRLAITKDTRLRAMKQMLTLWSRGLPPITLLDLIHLLSNLSIQSYLKSWLTKRIIPVSLSLKALQSSFRVRCKSFWWWSLGNKARGTCSVPREDSQGTKLVDDWLLAYKEALIFYL